ncbi:MAG: undecaprenyl-diphosphatase UppP [Candidatus Goldiibacteriota bacterium]
MVFIEAFLLGIIQGFTEFLPVSSSGHLVVFPFFIGSESELIHSLAFDAFVHGGTLAAVFFYFRKKLKALAAGFLRGLVSAEKRTEPDFKLALSIIAATVPAVIAALLFKDVIQNEFRGAPNVGINLIIFGIILFAADKAGRKNKKFYEIGMRAALIIGVFQALALMPGVSRSGITITAALFLGFARKDAAEFSFLLSVPAILGAFIFMLPEISYAEGEGVKTAGILAAGFISAAAAGFSAIKLLLDFVKKYSYGVFAAYRLLLGIFIILFFAGNRA